MRKCSTTSQFERGPTNRLENLMMFIVASSSIIKGLCSDGRPSEPRIAPIRKKAVRCGRGPDPKTISVSFTNLDALGSNSSSNSSGCRVDGWHQSYQNACGLVPIRASLRGLFASHAAPHGVQSCGARNLDMLPGSCRSNSLRKPDPHCLQRLYVCGLRVLFRNGLSPCIRDH